MESSTRSALNNPVLEVLNAKFDSRDLTLTSLFAALYVVINVVQSFTVGNPTIYGPIQLRIADFMIALTVLFGWPMVYGVTLGCFFTNAYFFIGAPDVVLGPIANLIASCIVLLLRKRRMIACITAALPIGLIVGGYLWLFFRPPEILSVLPVWAGMIASIAISSLVAIAVLGYIVLKLLSRPSIIEPLRSLGLRILADR